MFSRQLVCRPNAIYFVRQTLITTGAYKSFVRRRYIAEENRTRDSLNSGAKLLQGMPECIFYHFSLPSLYEHHYLATKNDNAIAIKEPLRCACMYLLMSQECLRSLLRMHLSSVVCSQLGQPPNRAARRPRTKYRIKEPEYYIIKSIHFSPAAQGPRSISFADYFSQGT